MRFNFSALPVPYHIHTELLTWLCTAMLNCDCEMFVHPEEQLSAWREQRGSSAGGGEADEAAGAGNAAFLQRDAGHSHWAQPALAGNTHTQPAMCLCKIPACLCSGRKVTPVLSVSAASYVPWQQHWGWGWPLEGVPEEERHERAAG